MASAPLLKRYGGVIVEFEFDPDDGWEREGYRQFDRFGDHYHGTLRLSAILLADLMMKSRDIVI